MTDRQWILTGSGLECLDVSQHIWIKLDHHVRAGLKAHKVHLGYIKDEARTVNILVNNHNFELDRP